MERIGLLGVGTMGEAILRSLVESGRPRETLAFSEISEKRKRQAEKAYGIKPMETEELFKTCSTVIIAVKPQDLERAIKGIDASRSLVVSIAAGVSSERIGSLLRGKKAVVRVMPNLPLVVGKGAIVVFKGPLCGKEDVMYVEELLSPLGETVILDEKYADAVTALSGSGPGFVALISEAFEDAGVFLGLPRDVARKLSLQTLLGSSAYMKDLATSPSQLKDRVSSPGGTTISGILHMERKGLRGIIMEAIKKAYERSKEL